MKAAVWHGRSDLRVQEWAEPRAAGRDVKIRVHWCGICGSDLHEFSQGPFLIPVERPHPLTAARAPLVLGHEFAGEVVAVGERVQGFGVGDRVAVHACLVCGTCYWCRRGQINFCLQLGSTGLTRDGGFAEFALVPDYACFRLPPSVPFEHGAFVEPLAVAVHAVRRAAVGLGSTVVVIGAGPVGLLVLQVARAAGAARVWVAETVERRRRTARGLGAADVFDPTQVNVGKAVHELTEGLRADVAFDCAGGRDTLSLALAATRRGGKIVNVAVPKAQSLALDRMLLHEKDLLMSYAYVDEAPAAVELLADGRVDCAPLITGRIGLEAVVDQGFETLLRDRGEHVKILVTPLARPA
jgi:(R,R)-butanediol dehydrogenase/meso-butanediol dehydrogenase/diacetyl reductase